jgi:hypothetical protein
VLEEKKAHDNQEDCAKVDRFKEQIENILKNHLKYNAEHILSKEEFEEIERENLIEQLNIKLKTSENGNENTTEFQKRLKSIQNLEETSEKTILLMKNTGINVENMQNQTISNASDIMNGLSYIEN